MQNFMKTILSAVQTWTKKKIKENTADFNTRIDNSKADWSENDSSKDNYIKNRTHWEEDAKKVILVHEQTINGFEVMEEPLYVTINAFYIEPEFNQTYTVTWDGIDYNVKLKDNDGLWYLGNENYVYMQGGGDIPFAIIFDDNIYLVTESTMASHTISISVTQIVVHKLDAKYIPENIATINDLNDEITWLSEDVFYNINNIYGRLDEIQSAKDHILLKDVVNGCDYKIFMHDGNLATSINASLDDFTYTTNDDGTYTITGWNKTYMGNYSTEMIIPDDSSIIL